MTARNLLYFCCFLLIYQNTCAGTGDILISPGYTKVHFPFRGIEKHKDQGSYQLNLHFSLILNKSVSITTGLAYEDRGYRVGFPQDDPQGLETKSKNFMLEYLVFPIYADYHVFGNATHHLSARVGIEVGRLVAKSMETTLYNGQTTDQFIGDYHVKKFITSALLGCNYRYDFWKHYFVNASPAVRMILSDQSGMHGRTTEGSSLSFAFRIGVGVKLPANLSSSPRR
jgi:hypothetical protein